MSPSISHTIALFLLIAQANFCVAAPDRLALVIGNANYLGEVPLQNTLNDAHDMAATLRHLDFDVTSLEDADVRTLRRGMNDFLDRISGHRGLALIYYSGHAIQDSHGTNYLLPVDAQIRRESHIRADGISINNILDQIRDRPEGSVSLLVLDACRNNPFSAGTRGSTRGLARVTAPPGGTLVLYAASPGQTADDNDQERNGLFTKHLLQQLPRPGVDIEDAFEQIALAVKHDSNDRQIPYKEGNLLGQHFLAGQPADAKHLPPPALVTTGPNAAALELAFWQDSSKCGASECFKAYLQTYPNGRFAPLAQANLSRLRTRSVSTQLPTANATAGVQALIDEYIRLHNETDIGALQNLYSARVNYFNEGTVNLADITKDKRRYFQRWPSQRLSLNGIPDIRPDGDGYWRVSFDLNFNVYSSAKKQGIRGVSRYHLLIREEGGSYRIASQQETVLRRIKYH